MLFRRREVSLFRLKQPGTDPMFHETSRWVVLDRRTGALSEKTTRQTRDCATCHRPQNVLPVYRELGYEQLPELIGNAMDPGAEKWLGMTRENYREYLDK